jgi:capsular polysaccharide biosynthesis protein
MTDEFNLSKIVEIIWRAKIFLVILILSSLLVSIVFTMFIEKPVYKAESLVFLVSQEEKPEDLGAFIEQVKNQRNMKLIFEKKTSNANGDLQIEYTKSSSLVKISYETLKPEEASDIANSVALTLASKIEISERDRFNLLYKQQLLTAEDELQILEEEEKEVKQLLQSTPEKLITNKSTIDDPGMFLLGQEVKGSSSISNFGFKSEEINPNYIALQSRLNEVAIDIAKHKKSIATINSRIDENASVIKTLRSHEYTNLTSEKYKNVQITQAIVPTSPVGSNLMIRFIIAIAVSVFAGLGIIFLREFYRTVLKTKDIAKNA